MQLNFNVNFHQAIFQCTNNQPSTSLENPDWPLGTNRNKPNEQTYPAAAPKIARSGTDPSPMTSSSRGPAVEGPHEAGAKWPGGTSAALGGAVPAGAVVPRQQPKYEAETGLYRRPKGRSPEGKVWGARLGMWVPSKGAEEQPETPVPSPSDADADADAAVPVRQEDDAASVPKGALVHYRVLRSFGEGEDEYGVEVLPTPNAKRGRAVPSAFFLGTVTKYCAPSSFTGGRQRTRRGGSRQKGVRQLDHALYRVMFDDGDVMDMEPTEVFQCAILYDKMVRTTHDIFRFAFDCAFHFGFDSDFVFDSDFSSLRVSAC